MSDHYKTDVIVIGAGPVGLFTIFELGMVGLKCHVVDALDAIGGQCIALYPEKPIYDIPAYPEISGRELVENLTKQAAPFAPHYHLNQQAVALEKTDNGFKLTTSLNHVIEAKAIIIAAGAGAFGPKRPPMPHLEQFEATSVHYFVKRRDAFKDKTLVIAGGGDSALDWAVDLSEVAKKIYLVHRRPKFRAAAETVRQMEALVEAGKIEKVIPYQLDDLQGEGTELSHVLVKTLDGEQKALAADALLPFFGLSTDLGPISEWGLGQHLSHIPVDMRTCQTNTAGIYAVGDIATYENKLKLILCGFSEAAMAARAAYQHIFPDQALHFEYSTSKGAPGENNDNTKHVAHAG